VRVQIPKAIGPFELRRAIGHGTYGYVYEGVDPGRQIRAAVKHYAQAPKGERAFARLRRDAQAAGALGHPNVATVIGVGEHEGAPWVATELVSGVSLGQVIRSRTFWPIERILDVWRQLCEGLAHAHREGLLHLDIKPSDVRVSADGHVKVVDFGAWHVRTMERRRSAPSGEGLHYRPPEVVAGERPDRRADIFAVGAVIYELVTRRKAFPGDATTDVIKSLNRCEPDLATLPSSPFSPGFEQLLAACLERSPDKRPASFEEVHADLVQLVRDTAPRLKASEEDGNEPPPERERLMAEVTRARAEDRLEDALDICRKLLALDREDEAARRMFSEVESVILTREADELVGQALTLAADGDIEKATRLAEKVERLAPWSPRYLELQVYLDEESARREADKLVVEARTHRDEGRDDEARAVVQHALELLPTHPGAGALNRELQGDGEGPGTAPPEPVAAPDPVAPPRSDTLTPAQALATATAEAVAAREEEGLNGSVDREPSAETQAEAESLVEALGADAAVDTGPPPESDAAAVGDVPAGDAVHDPAPAARAEAVPSPPAEGTPANPA
jgi:tetratricopeptide (TPR) repeat protein